MTGRALDWIPAEAFVEPKLLDRLDEVIAAWATQWFGERQVVRSGKAEIAPPSPAGAPWRSFSCGVWIAWSDAASFTLALRGIGLENHALTPSSTDLRLLSKYAERMVAELSQSLSRLGHLMSDEETQGVPNGGMIFKFSAVDDGFVLPVLLEKRLLTNARKSVCAPWHAPQQKPRNLSEVLGSAEIEVEASLGSVTMSAFDLGDISVGDTLVLERRISDPVLLRASATDTVIGHARLVGGDCGYLIKAIVN